MSHYRDLNKELVEQVQTMRVNIKLYCDEIISLKAELMQKYENELLLRKYCYNWALDNFQQLIKTVEPNSDILPLLKQYIRPDSETISQRSSSPFRSRTNERIRSSGSEKSSGERRRSSVLAMECQRSNSIINNRKSVRSCSPIRPSYDGDEDEAEREDEDAEEVEDEVGVLEQNRVSVEQSSAVEVGDSLPEANVERHKDSNFVIYEESEVEEDDEIEDTEEDEEDDVVQSVEEDTVEDIVDQAKEIQNNYQDLTEDSQEEDEQAVESVYESVEEVSINTITKTRSTLTDITNKAVNLTNSNNTNTKSLPKKRGRPKKIPKKNKNHTDTDTDLEINAVKNRKRMPQTKRKTDVKVKDIESSKAKVTNKSKQNVHTDTDTDMEISEIENRKQMSGRKRVTDDTLKDIENTTVQEPRRYSNANVITEVINKSIPIVGHLSPTCNEITSASLISVDMTLRNFKNAASSTPNSRHQSLRRPLTPPPPNSPYQSPNTLKLNSTMSDDNSNARPTRQCKPKVLAEPLLNTKLRNEDEFKKKPKTKTSKTNNKKNKANQC